MEEYEHTYTIDEVKTYLQQVFPDDKMREQVLDMCSQIFLNKSHTKKITYFLRNWV